MYYTDKDGNRRKVNYCGRKMQEEMVGRGWRLMISNSTEYPQQVYDRLSAEYSQVKVYYDTTMIRGLHDIFAFVKK